MLRSRRWCRLVFARFRARGKGQQLRRISFVALCLAISGPGTRASPSKRLAGNLVFWDQQRGFQAIVDNADLFTEISPFWYHVESDGVVVPYTTGSGGSYEDPAILSFLRSRRILIIPTVANIVDGIWDGALVERIISDAELRAFNIASLVQLAFTNDYDGIDFDYENLSASHRDASTAFVNELAVALHAHGKLLTVDVYARTAEPGTWAGPQSQDW
jgi:spore germination protein YaaH